LFRSPFPAFLPFAFFMTSELSLTLNESPETPDGVVRLDSSDMRLLGVLPGDILALAGRRTTYARALPAFMEDRNQRLAGVSRDLSENLGLQPGQKVRVLGERQKPALAEKIMLEVEDEIDRLHVLVRAGQLNTFWRDRSLVAGDRLRLPTLDRNPLFVGVLSTQPDGLVQIAHGTEFVLKSKKDEGNLPSLGGLRDVYRTCKTLASLRFKSDGPGMTRAVLLEGPSGCGKARLVTRLALEMGVPLVVLDVHHLMDKSMSGTKGDLPVSLTEIARRGPVILLLDNLEALTGHESKSAVFALAGRVVLSQLISLLDELPAHPNVMLFGVVSGVVEPRFIERNRFDLRLPVDAPHRLARHEILILETRNMPLAGNADLARLATMTAGTTGRDLNQLAVSAARMALEACVTESDFTAAFRHIEPSLLGAVQCDIPETSWDEVVGLDDVKPLLRETLSWSLQHFGRFQASGVRPPRSILLSGGQGTGKTSLVRALAGIIPMHFIELLCPTLAAEDPAKAAQYIHEGFMLARRKTPCLVFFDDIDVLFESGAAADLASHLQPVVARLLVELDNLPLIPGVVVIAATNRPDRLPTEIMRPGRFDYAVTLPMPDNAARKKILQMHAHKLPLAADVDIGHLAGLMQGMSPAEMANLCNRVGLMALRESLNDANGGVIPPVVNAALFEQALRGRKN